MDQDLSNYKIRNPLANLNLTREKKDIFMFYKYFYPFINYAHIKHTVKASSCLLQIQMSLFVLSLSSPNIQALANTPFLNESNRWYIPLIKLQDMKTYINPKAHMLMTKLIQYFSIFQIFLKQISCRIPLIHYCTYIRQAKYYNFPDQTFARNKESI